MSELLFDLPAPGRRTPAQPSARVPQPPRHTAPAHAGPIATAPAKIRPSILATGPIVNGNMLPPWYPICGTCHRPVDGIETTAELGGGGTIAVICHGHRRETTTPRGIALNASSFLDDALAAMDKQ